MKTLLTLVFVLFATVAQADNITANFSFNGNSTGWMLYMDGTMICSTADGAARTITCAEITVPEGERTFELSGVVGGVQTPKSLPYIWTKNPPVDDRPTIINMTFD